MEFTVEQVVALCGDQLPHGAGFFWSAVEHFRLEDGVLQPYRGNEILPWPGIRISTEEVQI